VRCWWGEGGGHSTVVLFLSARCEVLVVGGGPSGLAAALGARRAGADVILMERFGCFGGVITTVGMETLAWYR
jgi:flavin-dependent dehydrogenase